MNGPLSGCFYKTANGGVMIAPDEVFDADYAISSVTSRALSSASGGLARLRAGKS